MGANYLTSSYYCTISINSVGHVTCYIAAKILISAPHGNDCYIQFFSSSAIKKKKLSFFGHFSQHMTRLTVTSRDYLLFQLSNLKR
jgi:hypothetical protein